MKWEDPLPASGEDMVRAERVAESAVLAYRGSSGVESSGAP